MENEEPLEASTTASTKSKVLPQTQIRQAITPLLPPPVIQAWEALDPKLEPFLGPEPTITLSCTLLAAWFTALLIRFIVNRFLGSGKAYQEDDPLKRGSAQQFDHTVLLVGPAGGGKTRIFHDLCFDQSNVPTVQSLKANVSVRPSFEKNGEIIPSTRYMDWPGYAGVSLDDGFMLPILKENPRVVVVLDSSEQVTAGAEVLYNLLLCYHRVSPSKKPKILVACHKSDLPKAKNSKRIRLQMRSELERLLAASKDDGELFWPAGEPLEWEKLFVNVEFMSTSSVDKKTEGLVRHCQMGEVDDIDK